MCFLVCALAYAGCLYLVRQRKLPITVLRAWFTAHLLFAVILSWLAGLLCVLMKNLGVIKRPVSEALSRCACATAFGFPMRLGCQHVRVEMMEGSMTLADIKTQHDLCLCHASFFDTLLHLWVVPYRYLWTAKTFAKASLRRLPLFGKVIVACGHFPVYFASEESSSFSVNKAKQAKVSEQVELFLNEGGSLSFFPEGALNRTPEVLKSFRLGSFNQILQHKLPVYYCVTYGNHEVWHADLTGMPGYPADVYMYIGKCEYDPSKEDAVSLSTRVREEMQVHLDAMLALREKRGYKPWFVAPPPNENANVRGAAPAPAPKKKAA